MRAWMLVLVSGALSMALVQVDGTERNERLLHVPGAVLLLGYPQDDLLYVTRDGEEVTLRPPGPNRAGHHTYPSLSRDGTLVATSYVKSPHPNYREGIATYSLTDKRWKQYDLGDIHYVWAVTISPDGSTLAAKVERRWAEPDPLILVDLKTSETRVLSESFRASAPVSWSPDGSQIAYEYPIGAPYPGVDYTEYEIRIRDVRNHQERRLVSGFDPSWAPSGEWIAYLHSSGTLRIMRPDGTAVTALAKLRRRLPFFYTRHLMYPPVWSPDSRSLLVNESAQDETARALIHRFDLGPRRLRKLKGAGIAALGWSR